MSKVFSFTPDYAVVINAKEIIKGGTGYGLNNKLSKQVENVCLDYDLYRIKYKGYLVKLDTNGTNPEILEKLLVEKLVGYVVMDIKAPFYKYELLVGTKVDIDKIKDSIKIIKSSNIDYEFRTTACKELLSEEDILEIA
ncbi:hypothetical protein [Proteiniborus sp. MB09-C3]|uniref:hypothetical protein n=1 Tax=Proteiniborus sp. MB09-C3 TaxID=3050072 RepID=UPI002556B4F9|nr:hypothetical protein [Proteiniborus sp. MB09-C3]WIV11147.1 hypothetical protein QO263_13440 [Proteiniborus sp. MB09-C3]